MTSVYIKLENAYKNSHPAFFFNKMEPNKKKSEKNHNLKKQSFSNIPSDYVWQSFI